MAKTLTAITIANSKPRRRGGVAILTEISDAGCRGLRLVVHPSGHRSWIVRYRFHGRNRKLTLGPVLVLRRGEVDPGNGALTLPAARTAASEALHRLAQGFDPAAEKLAQQQQPAGVDTFAKVAEDYFARAAVEKDLRSGARQLADLKRLVFPTLGKRPIASIKRSDVVRLLDTISVSNGPTMADGALATISMVMQAHAQRTDDYASVIVKGMRRIKPKERARERILDDDELRRVWVASNEGIFGAFVRFLLLTAARRNEAAHLVWGELGNGAGVTWTLPARRNKVKVELARPLSTAAQAILANLPRSGNAELVFQQGGRKVHSNLNPMKHAFDKASGVQGWVLHDLRRTARSLMSRAGVNADIAERCLGHVVPGVRGVYDRHKYIPEMLHAYEALATLIHNIVSPPDAKVVSFAAW
jgi:integrase